MSGEAWGFVGLVVAYVVLMRWVLPRFGIGT